MDEKLCPQCKASLEVEGTETICYDPVVSLEVITYRCPVCGHMESAELMK